MLAGGTITALRCGGWRVQPSTVNTQNFLFPHWLPVQGFISAERNPWFSPSFLGEVEEGCEAFSGNKTSVVWMWELGVCLDKGFPRQGSCALRKTKKALSRGQRRGNFRYHKLLLRCFWVRRIKAQSFPAEYLIIKIMISMKAVHMRFSHFFPWKIMIQNSKKCFVCYGCFFSFFLPYVRITMADHKTKTMSWRMLTCSVKLRTSAESPFTLHLINMPYY